MSVRLRLVLDQVVSPTDLDLAAASADLARALVESAPSGCVVDAIAQRGDALGIEGIGRDQRYTRSRRELVAAWRVGVAAGAEGGLIHSPTIAAPLVRHERANDGAQTAVTLWDLAAWDAGGGLPRAEAAVQQAFLKRAQRHADAVVVPTHVMADRLTEMAKLGGRVRVIAGAAPAGYAVPSDAHARRRDAAVPESYVAATGGSAPTHGLYAVFSAARAADRDVVVLDVPDGDETEVAKIAAAAGLGDARVHLFGWLDRGDRAALIAHADAFVAGSTRVGWPWRAVEAMTVGTPVVAVDSPTHREVVFEGGTIAAEGDLPDALRDAVGAGGDRLGVLALDRARAFSWAGAAEQVWQLHAEL